MSEYFVIHRLLFFVIITLSLWLSFWVYFSNRKAKVNQLYSVIAILGFFWVIFSFLYRFQIFPSLIIIWTRLNWGLVIPFLVASYFFSIFFPVRDKKYPLLDKLILGIGIILFLTTVFTNLIIKDVEIIEEYTRVVLGEEITIFYLITTFLVFLVISLLLKKYFRLFSEEKLKIQYFLFGVFIFALINLIFNIILPWGWEVTKYDFVADYSIIFLLGFTAYAIVKRELFGIRVILTQALVVVIAILLLAQAITALPNWLEFSWKFALFLVFVYFGYLLIQSVILEIKRRAELQRLYEEVDRLSRAKSEFLSIASHQLRTPQTAIKGYLSMVLEGSYGPISERVKTVLEKTYFSNERLIGLINDLLNVSRIESGTLSIDLEKTSLEKMISSIVDEMRIKANEKKLYLRWKKPEKPLPEITVDPGKIRQVILNLIDNALKYTEKGGVTIATGIQDLRLKIQVKDTGEGMSKEERKGMFESFTRGKAGAKFWVAGLGLGLYIAKKFTELHGGKVWAESEGEGKGSTFYIELPVK